MAVFYYFNRFDTPHERDKQPATARQHSYKLHLDRIIVRTASRGKKNKYKKRTIRWDEESRETCDWALTLAPYLTSAWTIFSCPASAAMCSAVLPFCTTYTYIPHAAHNTQLATVPIHQQLFLWCRDDMQISCIAAWLYANRTADFVLRFAARTITLIVYT